MADWANLPAFDSRWAEAPPPTLVTRLTDAKTIRRQVHSNAPQTWEEEYEFTGAEHDTAHTFYQSKYLLTSFTKLSFDVHGTPTQERSVFFASPWDVTRAGPDFYIVRLTFERAY